MSVGYCLTNRLKELYDSDPDEITLSSENAVYTKGGLCDAKINKPFRFTAKTAQWIEMDFDPGDAFDFIALLGHNLTSGCTVKLLADDSSPPTTEVATVSWAETNMYSIFTEVNKRYWKLTVADAGNSTNPEICELYIGTYAQFSRMYRYECEQGRIFVNDIHQTEFGTITSYYRFSRRWYRIPWSVLSAAQAGEISTMYTAANGNLTPLVLVPDSTVNLCIFGRLTNPYQLSGTPPPFYSATTEFMEEPAGKAVAP